MNRKSKIEEINKQNKSSFLVYDRLAENEAELTSYLKYIRKVPQPSKIQIATHKKTPYLPKDRVKEKKILGNVKPYVDDYLKIIKEAGGLQSNSGRKIIRKLILYLEQFPSMAFLVEVLNSFGREQKKLCMNQFTILSQSTDEMIPLFQKIIQKAEILKKQVESKKLMELGHRITHLHKMVQGAKKQVGHESPIKDIEMQRVQKYLIMEENIAKAEKSYGKFSPNFHKNQEIFSNINKVYSQINRYTEGNKLM